MEYSTYARYAGLINKHIKPALGRKKIKDLNRTEVCRFYNESTGGLSQRSLYYLHVTLQMIRKQAVRDDLIFRNVAEGEIDWSFPNEED